MKKLRILCVIGTRPEVIKMSPIILELKKEKNIETIVLSTSQHKELLKKSLKNFNLEADLDLNIMKENQKLHELTSSILHKASDILKDLKPDLVLAQGDTTTTMSVAMSCFYEKIDFGHVEAGLRSGDLYNPFPEEFNRIVADRLAILNFAPTEKAKNNLIREGVSEDTIYVTGNTVIDALYHIVRKLKTDNSNVDRKIMEIIKKNKNRRIILLTLHRRESFGKPLKNILNAIKYLAEKHKDLYFVYPVHPNPNVRETAYKLLSEVENILLYEPVDYITLVYLMMNSWIVMTDSGGLQEEAPAIGKPVLVLRDTTERPEVIEYGLGKLLGRKTENIISYVEHLLGDEKEYNSMVKFFSPYGDGKAARRIVNIIKERYGI